jgi:hypothetical protein
MDICWTIELLDPAAPLEVRPPGVMPEVPQHNRSCHCVNTLVGHAHSHCIAIIRQ